MKKNMFFVIPEMSSKTFLIVLKNFLITLRYFLFCNISIKLKYDQYRYFSDHVKYYYRIRIVDCANMMADPVNLQNHNPDPDISKITELSPNIICN